MRTHPTSKEELARREMAYRDAMVLSETTRHDRNMAIRQAVADGWTHAQIAEAMNLTRARVGQIALTRPSDLDQAPGS